MYQYVFGLASEKDPIALGIGKQSAVQIHNVQVMMEYIESICLNMASIADIVIGLSKMDMHQPDLEKIKTRMSSIEWLHKFLEHDARYTSLR